MQSNSIDKLELEPKPLGHGCPDWDWRRPHGRFEAAHALGFHQRLFKELAGS